MVWGGDGKDWSITITIDKASGKITKPGGGLGNGPSIPVYSGHQAPMNQNTDVIDLLDD